MNAGSSDRTESGRHLAGAIQHLRAGQLEMARIAVDRILRHDPENFDAAHLRGVILFQFGDRQAAVDGFETALELRPDSAQAMSDLGMVLHALGRYREAEPHLSRAVELAPELAAAHLNLGNVLQALGRDRGAEARYRRALELQPGLGAALSNLSRILLSAGRAAESAELARRLIRQAPRAAAGHSRLGSALDRLGRFDEAIEAHRQAVEMKPADIAIRLAYAASLAGYGRMEDAAAQCREALERAPDSVAAHLQLSGAVRLADDPVLMARMEELMNRPDLGAADRGALGLALGRAREKLGDFEGAFATLTAANAMIAGGLDYALSDTADLVRDVTTAFDAATLSRLAGGGAQDGRPIFVVGMPRSGTTLTERILCSRPDVVGAGEPAILHSLASAACEEAGVNSFSALMTGLTGKDLERIGRAYVEALGAYGPVAARIVDKLPGNFLLVGLIHLTLPHARIVHCRRNPADTCLSVFKTRFATGNLPYAYDLDHLAGYYAAYRRVMAHWHEVLPGRVLDVDYEAMVADPRGQSQRLFAHCGLEWTEDALRFHETAGPVHTASIAQVRQPIHTGSRGMAHRYGATARPLFEALERAGVDPES